MQIFKIDSLNFYGKYNKPIQEVTKKVTNRVTNPQTATTLAGLTGLASVGIATVAMSQKKEKSFEQTLEENFFKLPAGAKPDIFQRASAAKLYKGDDVLVTAPTGTGKTAIAHYAISKNLEEGKKTFYTTPLKALSNEKFKSFQKIYGEENVGLLTGDTKINKDAPIVIMTTEVYRNMIFGERFRDHNPILDNLKTVVFDELHYLGDIDRGCVWEQSIILSDPKTQLLSLSATIGNNEELAQWMAKSRGLGFSRFWSSGKDNNGSCAKLAEKDGRRAVSLINVPSENRHVPLDFENKMVLGTKLQNKFKTDKHGRIRYENHSTKNQLPVADDYIDMISSLKREDRLPAIFFIFSKRASKNILSHLEHYGNNLNNEKDVQEINEIIKRYESEGKYLGESLNKRALEKGYAIHNSGLLPTQKELIEELFQKKLIKVVLATETLSAGINMPARSVVITSYMKPTSDPSAFNGKRELTPNEFHQMAGRAGRRGIDTRGYCYTMSTTTSQKAVFEELVASKPNELESAFDNPDYSFVASYYDYCENDDLIKEIAEKSFFAYDENPQKSEIKSKDFMKNFGLRRKILRRLDFMSSGHDLTKKGVLLTRLNGYEQIPIINAIAGQRLGGLDPIELAAAVGALANIQIEYESENNDSDEIKDSTFRHKNAAVDYFVNMEVNKLNQYNDEIASIDSEHRNVEFDYNAIHHIYRWAKANSWNEKSTENWANLMKSSETHPIKDEGTLFKEISMTIDLLKQISEICDEGLLVSDNIVEEKYYRNLKETAEESIKLLSKQPVI